MKNTRPEGGRVHVAENPKIIANISNNGEIYREFFGFRLRMRDLCPNYEIFRAEQGINRGFPVFDISHFQSTT